MKVRIKPWDEAVKAALADNEDWCIEKDGAWGDESIFGINRRAGQWGEVVSGYKKGDYFYANNNFAYPLCVVGEEEPPASDDLLHYGEIITDAGWADEVRIRLIAYDGELWWHQMRDGDVIECRKVGRVDA